MPAIYEGPVAEPRDKLYSARLKDRAEIRVKRYGSFKESGLSAGK